MKEDAHCEPAVMDSEDMLFLLYTSGSTGKPKGLVHSQAGYLLFAALTHKVMEPSHRVLVSWQFIDGAGNRCGVLLHHDIIFIQNTVSGEPSSSISPVEHICLQVVGKSNTCSEAGPPKNLLL